MPKRISNVRSSAQAGPSSCCLFFQFFFFPAGKNARNKNLFHWLQLLLSKKIIHKFLPLTMITSTSAGLTVFLHQTAENIPFSFYIRATITLLQLTKTQSETPRIQITHLNGRNIQPVNSNTRYGSLRQKIFLII